MLRALGIPTKKSPFLLNKKLRLAAMMVITLPKFNIAPAKMMVGTFLFGKITFEG